MIGPAMNRLKVLLYVALVTAAGLAADLQLSRWLAERTLARIGDELQAASWKLPAQDVSISRALLTAGGLQQLRARLGAEVTVVADGRVLQSTLPPREQALVAAATRRAGGRIAPAGSLEPQPLPLPLPVPHVPLLLVRAPAHLALGAPEPGGPDLVVLSAAVGPALAPAVTVQWIGLAAVVALLLAGLVVVALVGEEQRSPVSRELLAAADRMARGDFAARAPRLAGRLGTLAAALNRAAEAAQAAVVPRAPEPTGAVPLSATGLADLPPAPPPEPKPAAAAAESGLLLGDLPAAALRREPEPEPAAAPVPRPPEAPAPAPAPAPITEPAFAAPGPAAKLAAAQRDEPTARDFFAPPAGASGLEPTAAAAEPAAPPAPAAAAEPAEPAEGDDEEAHWKKTYQDFQRARAECGEARDGVPYEKFREKLARNREQLVERYRCRTVRFQVYVKEGKTALKASPVK